MSWCIFQITFNREDGVYKKEYQKYIEADTDNEEMEGKRLNN